MTVAKPVGDGGVEGACTEPGAQAKAKNGQDGAGGWTDSPDKTAAEPLGRASTRIDRGSAGSEPIADGSWSDRGLEEDAETPQTLMVTTFAAKPSDGLEPLTPSL
jgi:hypothetical protein